MIDLAGAGGNWSQQNPARDLEGDWPTVMDSMHQANRGTGSSRHRQAVVSPERSWGIPNAATPGSSAWQQHQSQHQAAQAYLHQNSEWQGAAGWQQQMQQYTDQVAFNDGVAFEGYLQVGSEPPFQQQQHQPQQSAAFAASVSANVDDFYEDALDPAEHDRRFRENVAAWGWQGPAVGISS